MKITSSSRIYENTYSDSYLLLFGKRQRRSFEVNANDSSYHIWKKSNVVPAHKKEVNR